MWLGIPLSLTPLLPAVWLGILVMLGYLVLFQCLALLFLTYMDGACPTPL